MSEKMVPTLVAGRWRTSSWEGVFQADNPSLGKALPEGYPISSRDEIIEMVRAGAEAAESLRATSGATIATFLETFAGGIERRADDLVEIAHAETGLPKSPRLKDVELPRTTGQLRLAAVAAREESWRRPIRDDARKIHSAFAPLGGPVVVMGPNNFPFAFNSAAGGDFAAAIAAHNPVIAKAIPAHLGVTRRLAEIAIESARAADVHPGVLQM